VEPLAPIAPPIWFGVAATALGPGILIGWAVENVPVESLTAGDWLRSLTMVGLAVAAPLMGAAALVRAARVPGFARILGPAPLRSKGHLSVALGLTLMLLCVVAAQVALGLVFDPRYKDFPFAPLTAAVIPYLAVVLIGPFAHSPQDRKKIGPRGIAETAFAALLGGCAVYIVLNESFANWQAVWLATVLISLAAVLLRLRDAQGSG
jgi:glucan 1,3-beta-glucosidase